jgi:xanthine/uracil permease
MAGAPSDRIEPVVLLIIGLTLVVTALLLYNGHPVKDSNLYSPSGHGWIAVVTFVLVGILWRLVHISDRRRAAKGKRNATPKT